MKAAAANNLFSNYTKIQPRVPGAVWMALRIATLAITGTIVALLFVDPNRGLQLFWGLAVPVLPALLVLAPGLWRQVCPMAFLNQLPRLGGFSRERALPAGLAKLAFSFAVALFVAMVALRAPLFNHAAGALAIALLGVLALALLGGLVFKGRSGWCGTFCPLAPIQRNYGHAPLLMVRNGFCPTCLGCQKNCYDFNPRAAVFADIYDDDEPYAGQRQYFMAMMPGLILGYFLQADPIAYGNAERFAILLIATAASVGLYYLIKSFLRIDTFRAVNLFAALALLLFYVFAGPIVLHTLGQQLLFEVPPSLVQASRFLGLVLAAAVLVTGRRNERTFREANAAPVGLQVGESAKGILDRLPSGPRVTERKTGKILPVAAEQTLLEALETAGVPINFGCRSGLCGADPVAVHAGADNLSAMTDDERATLDRLGLKGPVRLACMCQVRGPVEIDVDARTAQAAEAPPDAAAGPAEDPAAEAGIGKVVIVGNGVAGLGAAEALRKASPSVGITVVSDEPHHFYNRMAIGRVIYGRAAMDGLHLLPPEWYEQNRIETWRNTVATAIDRTTRTVRLGTGDLLPYDRLILATGASASSPGPEFDRYPNAFVLRQAADAAAIRARVQTHQVRSAVVIGGGVLGVEAADALRHIGVQVTILQRSGRLMDRQLHAMGAVKLAQFLENMGIAVVTDAVVKEFIGDSQLRALRLADGTELAADLFIASVGVKANTDLARAAGLEVKRGILVDPRMRTSDPDIYAAGDVAELPGAMGGLWPVGAAQASVAVAALLGRDSVYQPPRIVLQLKCDGIDLRSFGDLEGREGDHILTSATESDASWQIVERDGQVVGAVFVGPPGSARAFTAGLKEGAGAAELAKLACAMA